MEKIIILIHILILLGGLMFKLFKKIAKANNHNTYNQNDKYERQSNGNTDKTCVSEILEDNKNYLDTSFKNSSDVIFYAFEAYSGIKALIVYIDGLINKEILNRDVIDPFITKTKDEFNGNPKSTQELKKLIHVANIQETKMMYEIIDAILNGDTVMFFEGSVTGFIIDSKGWDKRAVSEPDTEAVIRGPREGYVESLRVNTALLRRKVKIQH